MFFKKEKKIRRKMLTSEGYELTKVGALYWLALNDSDLQRLHGDTTALDVAKLLEAFGYIEIVEATDHTGKAGLYYITNKGFEAKKHNVRRVLLDIITKIKPLFKDKELNKIASALTCLDTSEVKKCS